MPRGDRTGPCGFGPMTGRAAGYCGGLPVPGYMNPQPGFRGRGFGRGRGRGWGRGWMRCYPPGWAVPAYHTGPGYPNPAFQQVPPYGAKSMAYNPEYAAKVSVEQEVAFLKEQAALLKEELDAIEGRLEMLGKQEADCTGKDK